jgi:hypothetical protein
MRIPITFILLFGLGITFFQSCGPKTDITAISHYKLSEEFKTYCLFQNGSTWEYQSSLLAETESLSIVNIEENIWQNTFGETYKYEAIDMNISPNNIGISMIEITAGSTKNSTAEMNDLMWIFFNNGDYRLVFSPKYPLGEEQILGEHEGVYENVEILPNMSISEKSYKDVYHTRVTDYFENGMGDFDFYIAKNHGLIKMKNIIENDTITLQLVNSQLIQ